MIELEIKKLAELGDDIRIDVAKAFLEGFNEDSIKKIKNKEKLINSFSNSFNSELCYVALEDGHAVGLICCSTNSNRGIKINKKDLKKNLGIIKGGRIYKGLELKYNKGLQINDHMMNIDFLSTVKEYRGRGIGTKLLEYVLDNLSYTEYVIEFKNENNDIRLLCNKLGFKEVSRVPEKGRKNDVSQLKIYMNKFTVVSKISCKEYLMS